MKMVTSVMTLVLDLGSNIKLVMTLTLYLIPLNKIVKIKYTYDSLNQPLAQNTLWVVTILFVSNIMGVLRGFIRSKVR